MTTTRQFEKMQEAHEQEREVWAQLIGHMMLTFSDIEQLALMTIQFAMPSLEKIGASLLLEKRIDMAIQILEANGKLEPEVLEGYVRTLRNAQKLAVTRNLIAHNPVLLSFSLDKETKKLTSQGVITSARNESKQITLAEMKKYLLKVHNCRLEMNHGFSKIGYQLRFPPGEKRKPRRRAKKPEA